MSNYEYEDQASEGISLGEPPDVAANIGEAQEERNSPEDASNQQIHNETRSGDIVSPTGDNARVTINHFYGIIRYVEKHASHTNDDDETPIDIYGSKEDNIITENLLFGQQNISHFDDMPPKTKSVSDEPPHEEENLSDWYYNLDEYEQCYVQAVAILHGAAAQEIYKGADTSYRIIQKQKQTLLQPVTAQQLSPSEEISRESQTFAFPRKPRLKLQEHTYTVARRVKGTECIFWKDVDSLGQSPFESRVLSFLAREFISKGEHWEHFLKMIENWSSSRGGSSWRSARALGVILWYQDISQFQKKAETWAKKRTKSGQELAASFLDAAREIELLTHQEHAVHVPDSPVLQILKEWTEEVQVNLNKTNISVGCSTAKAYSLIGKKSIDTDTALRGVNDLLKFQQGKDVNDTNSLFAGVVSTYINLTWSGCLRDVLRYMAATIEELVHNWTLPNTLKQRQQHRPQREIRLKATLKAFFLVAAATSSEEQRLSPDIYLQSLEARVTIPDPFGRNVLIAAILIGDAMTESIRTVLCGAIVTVNTVQESKFAFELLRRWADMIITLRQTSQVIAESLYGAFVQFLVEIGRTIEKWCHDLVERGYRMPEASDIYKYKLEQWRDEGVAYERDIGNLAHKVLVQLSVNLAF